MPLSPGIRIGPYEIVAAIGAGGMGEVYRAHDGRLQRDVAIKVLPEGICDSPDRLRRFEQEARAASALNHPNILVVHDFLSEQDRSFLISELLEGESLRERLRQGALPQRKAIDYAVQIANGLAAAHVKGVVHRDIKPENLFLTEDGRIKILDFGLAKLTVNGEMSTATLTAAAPATAPGVVLGTVGYMSPEQVRGQKADPRSDIFALGAVLYEMLSGQRPFERESGIETMNAILKEDPPDLLSTNPALSPALDRLVRRAMEKQPTERFQSARDFAFALEAISGSSVAALPGVAEKRRPTALVLLIPAAVVLAFATAWLTFSRFNPPTTPLFQRLTFRSGYLSRARFSPDGQSVVYSANWENGPTQIYAGRIGSLNPRPLEPSGARVLSVSREGKLAVQLSSVNNETVVAAVAELPFDGGSPRELVDSIMDADWSPDGKQLAIARSTPEGAQVEFPEGKVLYKSSGRIRYVRFSPDGKRLGFVVHPTAGDTAGYVVAVDLAGEARPLTSRWEEINGLVWSRDGREIWFSAALKGTADNLYAATLSGKLRTVLQVPGSLKLEDISPTGQVLVSRLEERLEVRGAGTGPAGISGNHERDFGWLQQSSAHDFSADGKTLLMAMTGEAVGPNYGSCIRKMDGGLPVFLGEGLPLALSPDGKRVLSLLIHPVRRLQLIPTGAGSAQPLDTGELDLSYSADWLPDNRRIVFEARKAGQQRRLYMLTLDSGAIAPVTPEGYGSAYQAHVVSPDGKSLIMLNSAGDLFLQSLDGGALRPLPGSKRGDLPLRWTADGRSVYVQRSRSFPIELVNVNVGTGANTHFKTLDVEDHAGITSDSTVQISADGSAYAYSYFRYLYDLYLVDGLK